MGDVLIVTHGRERNQNQHYARRVTAMYQRLTERVPLFGPSAPWVVRVSFVLFVFVWFWELNGSLDMLSLTKHMHPTPKQHVGLVLMFVIGSGWQLLNVVLLIGIAYRCNWARVIELIITVSGMLLLLTMLLLKQGFDPGPVYFSNLQQLRCCSCRRPLRGSADRLFMRTATLALEGLLPRQQERMPRMAAIVGAHRG